MMISGETTAMVANMFNPIVAKRDIIYVSGIGTPQRLPVGSLDQVLCVDPAGLPAYHPLGKAAWFGVNIPRGVVQLHRDRQTPSYLPPLNSMTYKGTFGSSTSSWVRSPNQQVLDSDFFVADSYYSS
jgi:hypothetical protein